MVLYLTDPYPARRNSSGQGQRFRGTPPNCTPAGATTNSDSGGDQLSTRSSPVLEAMAEVGYAAALLDPRRSHSSATLMCSTAKRIFIDEQHDAVSSSRSSTLQSGVRTHHHRRRRTVRQRGFVGQRRRDHHSRTTCCTTVTTCWWAGSGRISTACRSSSANTHQEALLDAATSGVSALASVPTRAPHAQHAKEAACGCAGCYTAYAAIELYAEAFESVGRLDRLQAFASERGADFYGLPRNTAHITLNRNAWTPPAVYRFGGDELTPFRAGETIAWQLAEENPS